MEELLDIREAEAHAARDGLRGVAEDGEPVLVGGGAQQQADLRLHQVLHLVDHDAVQRRVARRHPGRRRARRGRGLRRGVAPAHHAVDRLKHGLGRGGGRRGVGAAWPVGLRRRVQVEEQVAHLVSGWVRVRVRVRVRVSVRVRVRTA